MRREALEMFGDPVDRAESRQVLAEMDVLRGPANAIEVGYARLAESYHEPEEPVERAVARERYLAGDSGDGPSEVQPRHKFSIGRHGRAVTRPSCNSVRNRLGGGGTRDDGLPLTASAACNRLTHTTANSANGSSQRRWPRWAGMPLLRVLHVGFLLLAPGSVLATCQGECK